jgi:hypothetical protein
MDRLAITLITAGVAIVALRLLVVSLRRHRPDLAIGTAIAVGFFVRVVGAIVVDVTPAATTLRGGDESTFLARAAGLIADPLGISAWLDMLRQELHTTVFALQVGFFHSPEFALRITQITIAVAGVALLATATHELAGARAAKIAVWLLALEPSNVFFSAILHKEPLMQLAAGLIAFGGAKLWMRASLAALMPMFLGILVATTTRYYVGWLMVAACGAVILATSMRTQASQSLTGLVLLLGALLLAGMAGPWALARSAEELKTLQAAQDYAASDNSNLSLERVDYSTPEAVLRNLPKRIRDMIIRPYPWEVKNASQRLGLLGTTFMLIGLCFLLPALWHSRGAIFARAGPLLFLLFFQLAAYSMSAGNAGTAFRYRTHLVAVGICVVVVLRERLRQDAAVREQREPVPLPATPAYAG